MKIEDMDTCGKCGGSCCKSAPGAVDPKDLGKTEDEILAALRVMLLGNYIFDYWEGQYKEQEGRSYFLRPKTREEVERGTNIVHGSWGGVCCFLWENGCALEYKDRPRNCREVVPNPKKFQDDNEHCTKGYFKTDALVDWYKYQRIIEYLKNNRTE